MTVSEKLDAQVECAREIEQTVARKKRIFRNLQPLLRQPAKDTDAEPSVADRIRLLFPAVDRVRCRTSRPHDMFAG